MGAADRPELQRTVLADGNYYHGGGTHPSMAELNEVRALSGHDQPTNDDVERFIGGPWGITRREALSQAFRAIPGD